MRPIEKSITRGATVEMSALLLVFLVTCVFLILVNQ